MTGHELELLALNACLFAVVTILAYGAGRRRALSRLQRDLHQIAQQYAEMASVNPALTNSDAYQRGWEDCYHRIEDAMKGDT